jgi:hypothetical protein
MSKKPLSLADVQKRLDRISADIEKATERGLTAAALDLPELENDLTHAALERTPLFVYVSAARLALSLGKLEAAQERIFKARCLTYPK